MHPLLATVTHARLRIAQGDLRGAREILYELLASEPHHAEARQLLLTLPGRRETAPAVEADESLPPRRPAAPAELSRTFRSLRAADSGTVERKVRRLRAWASRIAATERLDSAAD